MQILIVDDDPQILKFADAALTKFGHTCRAAPSGSLAMDLLQQAQFDVVLLDILMPDTDGIAILRYLSGLPEALRPKVVAMSGGGVAMPGWQAGKLAEALGAARSLFKPFSIDELRAAIEA
jgi:two-component system nitrogen regulation response regulator NtrX